MFTAIAEMWPRLAAVAHALIGLAATVHVLLTYRDPRSAVGWVGIVWLVPFGGALLYLLLGINRIRRRAHALQTATARVVSPPADDSGTHPRPGPGLERLLDRVSRFGPADGNAIELLEGGEASYESMLAAIENAHRSIGLLSYIFDRDRIGLRFVDALAAARARGVEVRVLVDAVGARYSLPTVVHALQRAGVEAAAFNPTRLPWRWQYFNLRNHRKILVVDGTIGFTGGMNIHDGCLPHEDRPPRVHDVHFRVEGPVVAQMQQTFCDDWWFTTGERLQGANWFPPLEPRGRVRAWGLPDGPDDDVDPLRWSVLGMLQNARSSVRVVTPYFLPDAALLAALGACALAGLRVELVIPERTNMRLVQWAHWAEFGPLRHMLETGVRVWLSPPPFDHTKLMVVDERWVRLGSANWDTRSFRLNFEFDLVCDDEQLGSETAALVARRVAAARRLRFDEFAARSLPERLRNALAGLLTPYL